jgi:hypothetical protein
MIGKKTLSIDNGKFEYKNVQKNNVLKRLKPKVKLLTDFYLFDTETGIRKKNGHIQWCLNARPESFIFGVVYGFNFQKVIYSVDDFKKEFRHPRYNKKKVFAHNATYDLGVLYGNIFDLDPNAIFNGKFICATNGVCVFADSMNIFSTSVKTLGKLLGIEKPDLGNDKMISKEVGTEEINRCVTDCQIVWESLYRIFEDSGDIKITQASLSMSYFRRFHQLFDIEHNKLTSNFWDSYFGGRCEAFKIGKTWSKVIDVNSMYPYAMKNCVFPNPKFFKSEMNVSINRLKKIMFLYEGLAYCEIYHHKKWLGFLPLKHSGKLMFPIGSFSGCWNFLELRFALEHEAIEIVCISKVVYSDRMESPFKNYVETLFDKRLKSNDEFEKFRIKIFMNSLYGKFAQRINEETIYIKDYEKQFDEIDQYRRDGKLIKMQLFNMKRKDCMLVVKPLKKIDSSFSIPSFASYITSFARVMLLKKLIELEKYKPVYCDTDSIFYEIDTGFESEKKLGGWKLENKIVTEIRGLKNYKFIDKEKSEKIIHRIKGVPKDAKKIGKNSYVYENLVKPKEALRRNLLSGVLIERKKEIKNVYDKRIVEKNGETKPIEL